MLEQPVRKFFRAGCFLFYSLFALQGFLFEGFKSSQHFFQTVRRKTRSFLCLIDFVSPVLALVFVEQIIIVFSGSFIKLTLVLKGLLFTALITAQLISLAFGKKYFPADFAFPEIQPPNRSGGSDNRLSADTGTNKQQHTPFSFCCLDTRGQAGYLLVAQNHEYAWKYSVVWASLYPRQSQGVDCP